MSRIFPLALVFVACGAATLTTAFGRTWTDRGGRKVEADLVAVVNGKVRIKRASDGKNFDVPIDRLSDADQAFVESQAKSNEALAAAREQTFADGKLYFVSRPDTGRVESGDGLLRMVIGLDYQLKPDSKPPDEPFSIVMAFAVKDTDTGQLYEHKGIWTPQELKDLKSGRTGAMLLGASSLRGEGDATLYLTKKEDKETPISNKISVPVLFK